MCGPGGRKAQKIRQIVEARRIKELEEKERNRTFVRNPEGGETLPANTLAPRGSGQLRLAGKVRSGVRSISDGSGLRIVN